MMEFLPSREFFSKPIRALVKRVVPCQTATPVQETLIDYSGLAINANLTALKDQDAILADRAHDLCTKCRVALNHFDFSEASRSFEEARGVQQIRLYIKELSESVSAGPNQRVGHVVHSSCLYEIYRQVTASADEAITYVIGSVIGPLLTLERSVPLPLTSASRGHARADSDFTRKILIECDRHGSALTAYFHSHPGRGASNTLPSDIDLTTQGEFESGGFQTIGGIFSRNGYLRFFTRDLPFNVTVIGKGVQREGENLYRLTQV